MHDNSAHTLTVRHSVPGRVRFKTSSILTLWRQPHEVERRLKAIPEIDRAAVRPSTGSVIVFYDHISIDERRIFSLVERCLDSITVERTSGIPYHQSRELKRRQHKKSATSLVYYIMNAAALSAFMGYLLIKRLFFKTPISQAPLSLTGMAAMAGALPLVRRAWIDICEGKRIGLFPFLAGSCILAVTMGQALAALEIIWVLAIGMLLEEYATEKARVAIRRILKVAPEETLVLVQGMEVEKSVSDVRVGDTVVVYSGQKIPCDGSVRTGEALVDEAHITGRSLPELRKPEDIVYAGTRVQQGSLHIRADKLGEDTYLSRISRLVEEALTQPTNIEKKSGRPGASSYTPGCGGPRWALFSSQGAFHAPSLF